MFELPKGMRVKKAKQQLGWEAGFGSELRKGLRVCKTFSTLLDSMTVRRFSERID